MGITLKLLFRQYIKHLKIYSTNIYNPCTQKSSSKMAFSRWKSRFSVFSEGSWSFLRKWKYTNQTQIVDWWISDLIPKKYEKFEFWENFNTMLLSVKNWPKKRIFEISRPRIFKKSIKEIPNFKVGYLPEKMKILKKYFFHRNERKILIA